MAMTIITHRLTVIDVLPPGHRYHDGDHIATAALLCQLNSAMILECCCKQFRKASELSVMRVLTEEALC